MFQTENRLILQHAVMVAAAWRGSFWELPGTVCLGSGTCNFSSESTF
jgi:hypothetical protein